MIQLTVNSRSLKVESAADTPLLWVLREEFGLTGTKFGCGIAQCGACTVLLDGKPIRSCTTPVSSVAGKAIVTIEGISKKQDHPVQKAWLAEGVVQCGYCQSGQILSAISLLESNPDPDDKSINEAMSGVICRCGTYPRIRKAIKHAAKLKRSV